MALLTLLAGLGLIAASLWLYRRQRLRYPEMRRPDRPPYAVSPLTRLFRVTKIPFYLALVANLVLVYVQRTAGPSPVLFAAGSATGGIGVLLLYSSLEALGRNFAPCDRGVLPFERICSGPYRWCRHPIYLGNLLLFIGIGIMSFGPLIAACIVFIVLLYASSIRDEERALRSAPAALGGSVAGGSVSNGRHPREPADDDRTGASLNA